MVQQSYDIFNRQEKPELTLCRPDKTEQYSLKAANNVVLKLRYNALSELEFELPESVNGESIPAYDSLFVKKLVKVDGYGYFTIDSKPELRNYDVPKKKVRAWSLEFTLAGKRISAFGGTYPLYDPLDEENSLLHIITNTYAPDWSIGSIDPELLTKFRTFDVSDTNVYNFLMNDASEAYSCIFTFDREDNKIGAAAIANATTDTDVYLSHDNVINSSEFNELSDEITTALYVYGANDLDIRTVNPLGTNAIYNYDYYKTTEWMSQGLIDALNIWEANVESEQSGYADTLTDLKIALSELVVLEGELTELQSELTALEGVRKVRIESGFTTYEDVNTDISNKESEITSKESEITSKNLTIDSLRGTLETVNEYLSFENNFTESQIAELNLLTYENTYQNENLEQLDSMDADEVQELAQELYDQGIEVLEKVSQPRYEYSMDTVSLLAIKEFEQFSSELNLGSKVYVEKNNGEILNIVLLEMQLNFDNPTQFSMTFSNRLRLDNGSFIFSDLFGQPVRTGTTVKFDKTKWKDWVSSYKDTVTDFITSSLDASKNAVVNAENEEILIDQNGIRGRVFDSEAGDYEDQQLWITSKVLAFSQDSFQTASLAIGNIDYNGSQLYGAIDGRVSIKIL